MEHLSALLNGLSYGMLLFLLGSGLSLVLGAGRFVNLAHGALYTLGGYVGFTVCNEWGNFWLGLLVGPALGAAVGLGMDWLLLRRLRGGGRELDQVLLTFGLALVMADATRAGWGGDIRSVGAPPPFHRPIEIGGFVYPSYPLVIIGVGVAVFVLLRLLLRRTRLGVAIRAAVGDGEMAQLAGVPTGAVLSLTFALGVALAALAGVVGLPRLALAPGRDFELLLLALVVVVMGGAGQIEGVLAASLLVGLTDALGKLYFPQFTAAMVSGLLAVVLVWRPEGLLGKRTP
ncbi:MAG: branched-chain amino acid ABC transporter permease [Dehalococcoidia bacterium]|nr:branched-chain amino acid ABC transporter permease [Dehalococcoidia bacterium]MDW8008983.1 branched-chain amino acid ABC transporter permease [Chloroflexota bacterium]